MHSSRAEGENGGNKGITPKRQRQNERKGLDRDQKARGTRTVNGEVLLIVNLSGLDGRGGSRAKFVLRDRRRDERVGN